VEQQLRIYRVQPEALTQWVEEWREQVCPLRRRFGFRVLASWVIEADETFVWILGYDGPVTWEEADDAYYASPERTALDPDPARLLAGTDAWMLTSVPAC
jgi:hypothetical protein